VLVLAACGSTPVALDNLNATLWVQRSVEFRGLSQQSYHHAKHMLDAALADPTWTADLAQAEDPALKSKPPAIILDVDETVLDNSPYQARLIRDGKTYNKDSWHAWCREAAAQPIPGAVAFTQYANEKGVRVIFITNRDHHVEDPTRANLEAQGFPIYKDEDNVLTRGEQPAWDTSDKTSRRAVIAEKYRILLLIGDNMGDFLEGEKATPQARATLAQKNASFWGTRWIVLANPTYGSWEGALINFDFGASPDQKITLKKQQLRVK